MTRDRKPDDILLEAMGGRVERPEESQPRVVAECWTCARRCQVHNADDPIGDCCYCESGIGSLIQKDGEWWHVVALDEMPDSACRAAGHDVREVKP